MKSSSARLVPLVVVLVLGLLAAATGAAAATAGGEGFAVAGKQTVVDEEAGTYKMTGGLVGDWKITAFKETASAPVFKGKGTELFEGCLDRKLDGACAGDPSGKLKFSFRYWGKFGKGDKLELGTCAHPIVGGSGDFAGATGFLMMVDLPTKKAPFQITEYEGVVTLAGSTMSARVGEAAAIC
jgi:hypothetical protein